MSVDPTIKACVFLTVVGVFVTSSSKTITHDISQKGVHSDDRNLRRFILTDNVHENWASWQQHVACRTTCVHGYESETVGCCTIGDNKLCYGLPWKLLNNSVGDCAGFCERKEQISCKVAPSAVCGSDGKMYENSCEFAKARCVNNLLIQKDSNFCNHHGVTSTLSQNITGYTPSLSMTTLSTKSITSSTKAMKSILTTRIRANVSSTGPTTKSTVPIIASTKSTISTVEPTLTVSNNAPVSTAYNNVPTVTASTNASASTLSIDSPLSTISTKSLTSTVSTNAPTSTVSTAAPTPPSYCENRHSISCGFTFKIVCGSDGKYYANLCMLALGRCDNPYLTQKKC